MSDAATPIAEVAVTTGSVHPRKFCIQPPERARRGEQPEPGGDEVPDREDPGGGGTDGVAPG